MILSSAKRFRLIFFYILLIIFTCSPIWSVEYFINQDGSGHIYTASLIGELLKNNPEITRFYTFNSISIPNSSGHWLLFFILQFFTAFTTTKIIVTIIFAGFVAATGFFRMQTVGSEGIKTSLLIGAAIGFNWLWLVGFYNFCIGVIGFLFTVGFFFRWREKFDFFRAIILSLLLCLTYFSHIISFIILTGSIFVIISFVSHSNLKKTLLFTLTAYLPVLPFIILYKVLSERGGGFSPVWRNLTNPYSLLNWVNQIKAADPFILISRKTLPFINESSSFFVVFTPSLWLTAAFFCLMAGTYLYYRSKPDFIKDYYPFIVLFAGSILFAMIAPDDFELTNGGVLRERFVICGLLFFIPLFRFGTSIRLKVAAQICLTFIIVFQTLALWDYSLYSNNMARDFFAAAQELKKSSSIASVTLESNSIKFHANPIPQMNNYNGIANNIIVWDNYEMGHYLFPVVTQNISDRQFIRDFTSSNFFQLNNPDENFDEKLDKFNKILALNHNKIETVIVWGTNPKAEAVLSNWFETTAYFQNSRVRLFHHK